jgi:hypothetical protein
VFLLSRADVPNSLILKEKIMKKAYVQPQLINHGGIEALTQATGSGDFLDAAFPTNTPKSQLTFS